ncbi:MAG TPA: hypothetical protein DC054_06915 [Blastocatellia bacterium]|nr:hypothetical protein [Blastocatellia bacterium]
MDRDKFVGIIISFALEGQEQVDHVLTRFVGEGNDSIVYAVAPLSDPTNDGWVIKFQKPDVKFEMTVLHYSFRIAEQLYPHHPLLIDPEERMLRLTDEMLGRIESAGSLFRLSAFRDMLMSTIQLLALQFAEPFRAGTLPSDWLNEVNVGILPMIDDSLVLEIQSLLDDEAFEDEMVAFFERILPDIESMVAAAKQRGYFRPLAQNRLLKLLGLHLEDFINWSELIEITDSARFRSTLTADDVSNFGSAVSILHFRSSGKKDTLQSSDKDNQSHARADYLATKAAAKAAAQYMDEIATKYYSDLPHLSAFAKNWQARTLLLEDDQSKAKKLYEEVLLLPITDQMRRERHDTLIDLSSLVADADPQAAERYETEALRIRQSLGKS